MTLDHARTFAVLHGVDRHESSDPQSDPFEPIAQAKENVRALTRVLTDLRVFGVPKSQISRVPSAASQDRFFEEIELALAKPAQQVIVYFAGHGLTIDSELYLATYKATRNTIRQFGINYDVLRERLSRVAQSKRVVVILDCCFSGLATTMGGRDEQLAIGGAIVLAATARDEVALAFHSERTTAFTGCLLEALRQGDAQRAHELSIQDLYEIVTRRCVSKKYPLPTLKHTGPPATLMAPFFRNLAHREPARFVTLATSRKPLVREDRPTYKAQIRRAARRVLLVKPRIAHPVKAHDFGIPLGPWLLANQLRERGIEADVFDERLEAIAGGDRTVADVMREYDVVGLSACSAEWPPAARVLREAHRQSKTTVVGGILAYSNEEYLLRHQFVDYVIPGAAITPLVSLVSSFDSVSIRQYADLPHGVFTRGDDQAVIGTHSQEASYPSLGQNTLREIRDRYLPFVDGKVDVVTSRGCRYRCSFCSIGRESRGQPPYMVRNVGEVLDEIKFWIEAGVRRISIKDEIFPINVEHSNRILAALKKLRATVPDLELKVKCRVDVLAKEPSLISAFHDAGIREIQFGVEALDDTILKTMKKGYTRIRTSEVLQLLETVANSGICVNASFVIGVDGEDDDYYDKFDELISPLTMARNYKVYLNFLTPHPSKNAWTVPSREHALISCNLERFTHKIPVVRTPAAIPSKRLRERLLATYDRVAGQTGTRLYNPEIPDEARRDFLESQTNYTNAELPVVAGIG